MNADFYPEIFKRRSFHLFRNVGSETVSPRELQEIARFAPSACNTLPWFVKNEETIPMGNIPKRRNIFPGGTFKMKGIDETK